MVPGGVALGGMANLVLEYGKMDCGKMGFGKMGFGKMGFGKEEYGKLGKCGQTSEVNTLKSFKKTAH
jgi:hypothetical protein